MKATKKSTEALNAPASRASTPPNAETPFLAPLNECDQLTQQCCDRIKALSWAVQQAVRSAKPWALLDAMVLLDMLDAQADTLQNDVNFIAEQHGKSHYQDAPSVSSEVFRNFREAWDKDKREAAGWAIVNGAAPAGIREGATP